MLVITINPYLIEFKAKLDSIKNSRTVYKVAGIREDHRLEKELSTASSASTTKETLLTELLRVREGSYGPVDTSIVEMFPIIRPKDKGNFRSSRKK